MIASPDFKTTSSPIVIDFLVRHGVISPETGGLGSLKGTCFVHASFWMGIKVVAANPALKHLGFTIK